MAVKSSCPGSSAEEKAAVRQGQTAKASAYCRAGHGAQLPIGSLARPGEARRTYGGLSKHLENRDSELHPIYIPLWGLSPCQLNSIPVVRCAPFPCYRPHHSRCFLHCSCRAVASGFDLFAMLWSAAIVKALSFRSRMASLTTLVVVGRAILVRRLLRQAAPDAPLDAGGDPDEDLRWMRSSECSDCRTCS
jgi:hypothetical protein